MIWNWRHFAAAAFVGGAALLKAGAPPFAIAMGIAIGALLTRRATRSA
jgi:hypothetical protein